MRVLVKDVKEKRLPDVTDEWAAEASEFSTVEELRADLRERMARIKTVQAQLSLRQGALAALAELVEDDQVPDALVEEALRERLHELGHRLEQQGVDIAQFLQLTGRSEEDFLAEARAEARQAVKSDLGLRSLAEAERIDASDAEVEEEIAEMAARLELEPSVVRERLTRAGRIAAVRSEQRKAKALAWLLDHVEVVDEEGASVSRDDLRADQGTGGADVSGSREGSEQPVSASGTGATNGETGQ